MLGLTHDLLRSYIIYSTIIISIESIIIVSVSLSFVFIVVYCLLVIYII